MGVHIIEGNPPIAVELRRNKQAKRLSLRVSRLDGRVALTLPQRTPEHEALAFLRAREAWLRGHLADMKPVNVVKAGGTVLLYGQHVPVVVGAVKRARLSGDTLLVPQDGATGPRVQAFLKLTARDALAAASDRYAAALGRSYSRLSIRDTRSRWGSCSSRGVLMYSWRLIMAPPAVLEYVAAHEVAHLAEMNHSPAFWAIVEKLFPGHQKHRDWLRQNGDQLHRVQFD